MSLHSDVTPNGAQGTAGYPDVELSLRVGAKLYGIVVGGSVELAGMIDAPGARYLSLFAGMRTLVRSDLAVEFTAEIGTHTFSDVGTAARTYDVISETPASRPFWGARWRRRGAAAVGRSLRAGPDGHRYPAGDVGSPDVLPLAVSGRAGLHGRRDVDLDAGSRRTQRRLRRHASAHLLKHRPC